jgi:prevent-host-death family protein
MSTVSIRDLTRNASRVVEEVTRTGRPALVTKRGRLVAAVIPIDAEGVEDYVMANSPDISASLAEADADLAAGRAVSHEDVFAHLSDDSGDAA